MRTRASDGKIDVAELDPITHSGKPLRRIFLDHRDPEHLWIRSYDLPIYDTHVGATQMSQTHVSDIDADRYAHVLKPAES